MLRQDFADRFAVEWVEAWNNHDLERILSHYADDIELTSPYVARFTGEAHCRLQGKAALAAYWAEALRCLPDLRFELVQSLVGVDSIVLYYRGVHGMAAEVFFFGADGKVSKTVAHYTPLPGG